MRDPEPAAYSLAKKDPEKRTGINSIIFSKLNCILFFYITYVFVPREMNVVSVEIELREFRQNAAYCWKNFVGMASLGNVHDLEEKPRRQNASAVVTEP